MSADTSVEAHADIMASFDTHETCEIIAGIVPLQSLFHVFTWFSQVESKPERVPQLTVLLKLKQVN